jgi:hypothetical protein
LRRQNLDAPKSWGITSDAHALKDPSWHRVLSPYGAGDSLLSGGEERDVDTAVVLAEDPSIVEPVFMIWNSLGAPPSIRKETEPAEMAEMTGGDDREPNGSWTVSRGRWR